MCLFFGISLLIFRNLSWTLFMVSFGMTILLVFWEPFIYKSFSRTVSISCRSEFILAFRGSSSTPEIRLCFGESWAPILGDYCFGDVCKEWGIFFRLWVSSFSGISTFFSGSLVRTDAGKFVPSWGFCATVTVISIWEFLVTFYSSGFSFIWHCFMMKLMASYLWCDLLWKKPLLDLKMDEFKQGLEEFD